MPYPVSTARLCLAPESSAALDDAVSVARRRQHAQTTSLHVVFALLSTSTSSSPLLRDALSRARSSACSQRLQFKALELCFGVALDRLPSSSSAAAASTASDEPPLANSLMAAIKRSQANQRRHPDTFHFYQQQMNSSPSSSSSSSSSFSGVKVELQQLILAILDDPIVSRVFGEAGFRSTEIKLAVLRPPPPPILQFPRAARRPLFLCNFSAGEDLDPVGLTPPPPRKLGFGFSFSDGGEENCRRIGEIMAGKCNRNPMLVGIGAADAARDFARAAERQSLGILPPEMSNLKFVNLEREIFDIKSRLDELGKLAEESKIAVGIGDLKELDCLGDDLLNCLVKEITRALEMKKGRFWVVGWSATYETYMKFLSRYPTLDKDWDLQLQLITSAARQPAVSRPPSLMESFVPFGGLFPTAYESNIPVMKQYSSVPRCQLCNDKYEEELATVLKGCTPSCVDQNQAKLPLWLQSVDMVRMNNQLDVLKVKDDEKVLNVRAADLQKKWNDYCQRQHQAFPKLQANKGLSLPPTASHPSVADKNRSNPSIMNSGITQIQSGFSTTIAVAVGLQKSSTASNSISLPMVSGPTNKDLISKLQIGLSSHQSALTDWSTHDDRTSPSSVTSVTTDLVLGTVNEPSCAEELACRSPSKQLNEVREHQTPLPPKPCLSSSNMSQKLDPSNLKAFYNSLLEKVGRQDAAVFAVSQAITRCRGQARRRGASPRGDIWLSFIGQDMLAKKKAAKALAELMYGSKENMICIDLDCQESLTGRNSIFYRNEVSKSDVSLRGKTVDDRIAGQISKRPSSVVFLENVEKADIVVQEKLKHAICTGKISDSHGREFSINNAIFVVTTSKIGGKTSSPSRETVNFSEEKILAAQRWQMKMSVEPISKMTSKRPNFNPSFSWRQEYEKIQAASKRKLEISDCQRDQQQCSESPKRAHRISKAILDLNLPVEEEEEENDADCSSSSNSSGNEDPWLDEFLKLIDETVSFEPFNFDALSECIMKEIKKRFCSTISSECLMEIDKRAMEEILAASLLLEDLKDLNNWIENVLVKGFVELRRRHSNKLSTHSTVRLVALEETFAEEHAHGVLLPSRIILDLLTTV